MVFNSFLTAWFSSSLAFSVWPLHPSSYGILKSGLAAPVFASCWFEVEVCGNAVSFQQQVIEKNFRAFPHNSYVYP